MYVFIDRRKNLKLRKEIDDRISSLRKSQLSLMYLQEFYPQSEKIRELISECDAEIIAAMSVHPTIRP